MRWLHGRTKGVYAGTGNAAVSVVAGSMQVQVAPGIGWITDADNNGVCWWFDAAITLDIDPAEATGTLNRIDRVIVEWKTTDYADLPEVKILTGTSASSAVAPALTNNSTVRQLSLARISIPAGTTELTSVLITDERLDPEVCGIVTETVTADTSMIAAQYEAAVAELYNAIAEAWDGEISDGAITLAKLASEAKVHRASITVPYASWTGADPYTQTVTISGATITANTKVDIQTNATALAQLLDDGVTALFIENNNGALTLYAIGAATTADITVQVTYYETV